MSDKNQIGALECVFQSPDQWGGYCGGQVNIMWQAPDAEVSIP